MQIVDAQIHVWGSGLPSNLAHRQVTAFTTEEAVGLMDAGGVDAAVIHPPGWDPGATAMADVRRSARPRRLRVGTLQCRRGFQPVEGPGEGIPGEAP